MSGGVADPAEINLAIAAKASFIVSRDKHLLDLMKDNAFRTAYPALTIVDPPSFLTHVRSEVAKKSSNE